MSGAKNRKPKDPSDAIEAPAPTIVGPRPDAAAGASISVPRGMERLLALAGLSEEWKEKTLADPLSAAAEADIALSSSESAILEATPRKTLGQMILTFARTRLPAIRGKALTAGAAAAALLASTNCDVADSRTAGISPDEPVPLAESGSAVQKSIEWQDSLDAAMVEAIRSNRAVMVVCPYAVKSGSGRVVSHQTLGLGADRPPPTFLETVCQNGNAAIVEAAVSANLIATRLEPYAVGGGGRATTRNAYVNVLEDYGLVEKAPLILFLAPDRTLLHWENQCDERHAVSAIQTVPPLMTEWLAQFEKPVQPAPAATRGHTTR